MSPDACWVSFFGPSSNCKLECRRVYSKIRARHLKKKKKTKPTARAIGTQFTISNKERVSIRLSTEMAWSVINTFITQRPLVDGRQSNLDLSYKVGVGFCFCCFFNSSAANGRPFLLLNEYRAAIWSTYWIGQAQVFGLYSHQVRQLSIVIHHYRLIDSHTHGSEREYYHKSSDLWFNLLLDFPNDLQTRIPIAIDQNLDIIKYLPWEMTDGCNWWSMVQTAG